MLSSVDGCRPFLCDSVFLRVASAQIDPEYATHHRRQDIATMIDELL